MAMSKSQAMMTVRHANESEKSVTLEKCFGRRSVVAVRATRQGRAVN